MKGLRDRRHHHQTDRHLDHDQVVSATRGFGGQGEQLPHRERLLFQTRPRSDAVPDHVPGCHGFLEDDERLPHHAVQGQTVAGAGALRVVQQDQVQSLAPDTLWVG
ncbi:hypothetical protein ACFU6M_21905 [Streptomyces bottropensis]|uniref:hypothetical protein n=1 Tax=Streptomyces bottropensis TaxID=42235 RepID=UPI003695D5EB